VAGCLLNAAACLPPLLIHECQVPRRQHPPPPAKDVSDLLKLLNEVELTTVDESRLKQAFHERVLLTLEITSNIKTFSMISGDTY